MCPQILLVVLLRNFKFHLIRAVLSLTDLTRRMLANQSMVLLCALLCKKGERHPSQHCLVSLYNFVWLNFLHLSTRFRFSFGALPLNVEQYDFEIKIVQIACDWHVIPSKEREQEERTPFLASRHSTKFYETLHGGENLFFHLPISSISLTI